MKVNNVKGCLLNEKPDTCEECRHNCNIVPGWGGIIGPCGQQNCWYDCVCCRYNAPDGIPPCEEDEKI